MKRMYFGLGLLTVLLSVAILLTMVFVRLHDPLPEALERAQNAALAGDWEEAAAVTEKVHKQWKRFCHFTAAVADHEPMEEMDAMFARLEVLCRMHQADEFVSDCAELAKMAQAMTESQKLVWWNLL